MESSEITFKDAIIGVTISIIIAYIVTFFVFADYESKSTINNTNKTNETIFSINPDYKNNSTWFLKSYDWKNNSYYPMKFEVTSKNGNYSPAIIKINMSYVQNYTIENGIMTINIE